MWLEIIVGVLFVAGMTFLLWKLYDDIKMKILRRRYKQDDDPGRKSGGDNIGPGGIINQGEPTDEELAQYAKQSILSSGDGGLAARTPKYIIRN